MNITILGIARYPSPLKRWVNDQERIPATIARTVDALPADDLRFELAGARETLFFDPPETRAGIVTCGGLCPGLNDVIRSLFFELHHAYGVKEVLGFRWGYQGLDPEQGAEPLLLTPELVDRIHLQGGHNSGPNGWFCTTRTSQLAPRARRSRSWTRNRSWRRRSPNRSPQCRAGSVIGWGE